MLRKRLIAVVTVRNGWAVQSFGYHRYLPLGRPECLVENLDRWGADEILVQCMDRSTRGLGPDLELLSRLGRIGLRTPLVYGGGISTADQAVRVIHTGADRIMLDHGLCRAAGAVRQMSSRLGAQALIACVPVEFQPTLLHYDYAARKTLPFSQDLLQLLSDRVLSEVMLTDRRQDGGTTELEPSQLAKLPWTGAPLILFGGFTDPQRSRRFLEHEAVAAIAVGNTLSYHEHAYQHYKQVMNSGSLRQPVFAGPALAEGL
ncbi:hypothetical protein BO996_00215 [Delftia sp. HK171]|uniref:HisA/HisF-related TIM barrel protein n=1 Tax=Delftia sp. HK171 TaxID=1920191 RepID=UPI000903DE61|nr:HisA/HisF-related TIM barrel protein [Delftia sp. HK171]APE46390.1 hypothetical protein BO996_00215 [Delftia sp. HK171]